MCVVKIVSVLCPMYNAHGVVECALLLIDFEVWIQGQGLIVCYQRALIFLFP